MKIIQFIPQLCNEASKSNLSNKHACVALKKGRMITPMFHNYVRSYMCGYKCGTAHAEMVALHHLLFSLWGGRPCEKRQCILQDVAS